MLGLDELKKQIDALQQGQVSLDAFEDWFRTNSRGSYASPDRALSEAAASVEAAFSRYSFEESDERRLRDDLLRAAYPLAWLAPALMEIELIEWSEKTGAVHDTEENRSEAFQGQPPDQLAGTNASFDITCVAA
ncbi:MAG TPA: hypothetical protein VGP62_08425 [Bryobacteraceae bacterium]|nr:hypothetical protein [Bryobacteraceae bacterium]